MAVAGERRRLFPLRPRLADPRARRLERLVAWRCRALGLPYGDQGLLLPRALLAAVGGMRPLPLMEDVDLVRRLGRRRLVALDAAAVTSAARWEREGWCRRSARNLACLSALCRRACRRARSRGCTREGHRLRLRPRAAPRHGEAAAGARRSGRGRRSRSIGRCWRRRCAGWRATGGFATVLAVTPDSRAGLGRRACRASGRGGGIWARAWRGWCGGIRADGWRSSAATSPASAPPTWRPRSGGWARRTRRSGRRRMAATGWWRSARAGPPIPSGRALVGAACARRHTSRFRRAAGGAIAPAA